MTNKLTTAERLNRAMRRAEEAACDLLHEAERWTLLNRSMFDIRNNRRDLLSAARRYASAMKAVASVKPR